MHRLGLSSFRFGFLILLKANLSASVLRAAEGAVAGIGAVTDSVVRILSRAKRPKPLVIGSAGTALHPPAMIAPRALAAVDPSPVAVMVVVGVEVAHYRLASWSHPSIPTCP